MVHHADCQQDADKLYDKIKAALPSADIWRHFVGPVLGGHAGPEAIALTFVSKTDVR
jgi:fatty acid-binding protein DegV